MQYTDGNEVMVGDVVRGKVTGPGGMIETVVGAVAGICTDRGQRVQVIHQETRVLPLGIRPEGMWLSVAPYVMSGHDQETGATVLVRQLMSWPHARDLELIQRADGTKPASTAALVQDLVDGTRQPAVPVTAEMEAPPTA